MKKTKTKSKKEAAVIKTLIVLLVGEMLLSQTLSPVFILLIYPALLFSLVAILPILYKNRKTADFNFFGNLCFAAILTIVFYLLLPAALVAGFLGAAILGFVYVFTAMATERFMQGDVDAVMMTMLALTLTLLTYAQGQAPQIIILAFLSAAIFLDLTRMRFPMWVRGMFAGIVWSSILFGFSGYDLIEVFTAVTFSALAGLVTGSLFSLFHLADEKHIEKMLKRF
jgi:hypothetical protein